MILDFALWAAVMSHDIASLSGRPLLHTSFAIWSLFCKTAMEPEQDSAYYNILMAHILCMAQLRQIFQPGILNLPTVVQTVCFGFERTVSLNAK